MSCRACGELNLLQEALCLLSLAPTALPLFPLPGGEEGLRWNRVGTEQVTERGGAQCACHPGLWQRDSGPRVIPGGTDLGCTEVACGLGSPKAPKGPGPVGAARAVLVSWAPWALSRLVRFGAVVSRGE